MPNNDDEFYEEVGTDLRTSKDNYKDSSADPDDLFGALGNAIAGIEIKNAMDAADNKGPRAWAVSDDVFWQAPKSVKKLPNGLYEIVSLPNVGIAIKRKPFNTDELIIPPDETIPKILAEFKLFWSRKEEFVKRGLLYKRGFILYGPPGGGKTSLLSLLTKTLIKDYNGIVVDGEHPDLAAIGLRMVRKIEPTRPVILMLEDLDSLIERHGENDFLSLLDGEDQIDNIVTVATTNYPSRLDKRLVNRPSRFDKVIKIDMPNEATRRMYLQAKEKSLEGEELEKWVKLSKDFSLAHLKEMIVAVKCLDQDLDEVVERLKKMRITPKDADNNYGIGFNKE
ncbi:MAG TPA: ATP-binding protein [Nitrosopumilaceae archaeon]|jgi:SpoVK/Ycf46/Vps4 family AAA+-type ATPase|nr:ATP-binding protein [Nitrosopumilaceae archaeon]